MGPFYKYKVFEYQSEIRMVFGPGLGKPLQFRIGPIDDIAEMFRAENINKATMRVDHLLGPKPRA